MTYRMIPDSDLIVSYRASLREALRAGRENMRSQRAMFEALRPRRCAACGAPIERPARGRPPTYCAEPACRRRAAADRQARKRRRDSGLPPTLEAQPRGGRSSLLARTARRRAADWFPSLVLTAEDLVAVELLVRTFPPSHSRTLDEMADWLDLNGRKLRDPAVVARIKELIRQQRDA